MVLGGGGEGAEVESGFVDRVGGEALEEFGSEFFVGEFGGFEHQADIGAGGEDFAPDLYGRGAEFHEVVEGGECEGAVLVGCLIRFLI